MPPPANPGHHIPPHPALSRHGGGLAGVEAHMLRTVLYSLAFVPVAYVLIGLLVLTGQG